MNECSNVGIALRCRAALGLSATVAANLLLHLDGVNLSHSERCSDLMRLFIRFHGTIHQPHLLIFTITNE